PDIIQSQEQLNTSMQDTMGKQQENNQKGNQGKEGQRPEPGANGEAMSEKLFEIYKQQQLLRNALEDQIHDFQNASDQHNAQKAIEEMKQLENDLIEKGFTQGNQQKMLQLHHHLLNLENAATQQGEKPTRESKIGRAHV